jgi:hypothetical protein
MRRLSSFRLNVEIYGMSAFMQKNENELHTSSNILMPDMKSIATENFLDKSFTLRQALRWLAFALMVAFVVYFSLFIRNAWIIKMGGIGIAQMRYGDFPKECQRIVDIHRGGTGGTLFDGIVDRTIYRDINSLIDEPVCWAYAIRAGVDAKPVGSDKVSNANLIVIFTKPDPANRAKKIDVLTLQIEYHD